MSRRGPVVVAVVAAVLVALVADVALGVVTPGVTAVTAIVGAFGLVLVAKGPLKRLIRRPEDYYERLRGPGAEDTAGRE